MFPIRGLGFGPGGKGKFFFPFLPEAKDLATKYRKTGRTARAYPRRSEENKERGESKDSKTADMVAKGGEGWGKSVGKGRCSSLWVFEEIKNSPVPLCD
jgi:hypothetical protein